MSLSLEQDLSGWKAVPRPERVTLEGRYTRLEPLDAARHGADLYAVATSSGAEDRFRYLFETRPADAVEFAAWTAQAAASTDPLFFAVVDGATGRAEGRQALMRIDRAGRGNSASKNHGNRIGFFLDANREFHMVIAAASGNERLARSISALFDEMARLGAQITIFRLGSDPGLARFIDQVARRVEGRVVEPDLDGLGAAVVGDYLRSRRRRR